MTRKSKFLIHIDPVLIVVVSILINIVRPLTVIQWILLIQIICTFVNASYVVMLSPFLFLMLVSGICMYNDIVCKVIPSQIRMLPTFDSIIFVSVDEMPEFLANFLNTNYRRDIIRGPRGVAHLPLPLFLNNKIQPIFIHHKRQNQFKILQRGDCRHRSLLL